MKLKVNDWEDNVKQLKQRHWLTTIVDLNNGKNIYCITEKGKVAYESFCQITKKEKLFNGYKITKNHPKKSETEIQSFRAKSTTEKLIVKVPDGKKTAWALRPKCAQLIFVMCDLHGKEVKEVKTKKTGTAKPLEQRIGEMSIKVIKGVNKVGKTSADIGDAIGKIGDSMSGETKGKKKKRVKDEYSLMGEKMMKGAWR